MEHLAADLPELADMGDDRWRDALDRDRVEAALKRVVPQYVEAYEAACRAVASGAGERLAMVRRRTDAESLRIGFEAQVRYESAVAGSLLHLVDQGRFDTLANLFYSSKDNTATVQMLTTLLKAGGPIEGYVDLDTLNPRDQADLAAVALSPISVVHLFRQYFFELDSFLGTPVGHVWLSPGSTVELIEVQTRRTLVEKLIEQAIETVKRSESETTERDEISDAVKEDNRQEVKFGASVSASYASIVANSSFRLQHRAAAVTRGGAQADAPADREACRRRSARATSRPSAR